MGNVPTINAIPTQYKGIEFRSRTEARWAVFFDHIGIKWEFEAEGYDLGDGELYLPDFWLPEMKSWFEVKPSSEDGLDKAQNLVRSMFYVEEDYPGEYFNVFISDGPPSRRTGEASPGFRGFGFTESDGSWGEYLSGKRDYAFYVCPFCGTTEIGEFGLAHNPARAGCEDAHSSSAQYGRLRQTGYTPPDYTDIFAIAEASDLAMKYRFWNPGGAS